MNLIFHKINIYCENISFEKNRMFDRSKKTYKRNRIKYLKITKDKYEFVEDSKLEVKMR